nr:hypothetical protein Iba_scaffold19928CG0020 [Ipomoea batatas]GME19895.1 hypothetical protein Iba_scaffold24013CG0280 [Ipomoea batatas]
MIPDRPITHCYNQRRESTVATLLSVRRTGESGRRASHRRCFLRSESTPLLLEVGIYGGSPEICTLSRTNAGGLETTYVVAAGCRALFCLTPSEVGALNFAAILLIHCHRRSLFVVDDEGRKMMK